MLSYLSKVFYVLTGGKGQLVLLLLAFISASVLEVLGIGLIGPFLGLASNPELVHKVPLLNWAYEVLGLTTYSQMIPLTGLLLVIVFCIRSIAYFLVRFYIFHFCFTQKKLLTSRLVRGYLAAPYTFHLQKNTANVTKNVIWEIDQFTNRCLVQLLNLVANFFAILCLLCLLAATDSSLLLLVLAVLLPIFFMFSKLSGKFKEWGRVASESQRGIIRTLNHSFGGLKETRIIGCESHFEKEVVREASRFCQQATLSQSANLLPGIVIQTAVVAFMVLSVSLSQTLSGQSMQETVATLGVFAFSGLRLVPYCSQFIAALGNVSGASYPLEILYLDLKEVERERSNSVSLSFSPKLSDTEVSSLKFEDKLELQGVTYRYPSAEEPSLKNVSLSIKRGESIAFIGKSGAGKTTLVDVILGLLQPEEGNILLDGISIYKHLRAWQNLVGYIPQSIFLIDDTIEKNIAFGVPDEVVNIEKLEKVVEATQLSELVKQLPKGLKTEVGERGIRLSGGQRQRIGIARALYHEREILVLDEATAALDNQTESLVTEAINSLTGAKTLIIIAHRLSTVEHCDRIYLMERGSVVQSGSYAEVVLG